METALPTYDAMLARLRECTASRDNATTRLTIPVPVMGRIGTKKTSIANFTRICEVIGRDVPRVARYFDVELAAKSSVDEDGGLTIRGRFKQSQIEKIIKKYISEYVACKVCGSLETTVEKQLRIEQIQCAWCKSRRTIQHV